MSRRRLRLICSSDEEDEPRHQQQQSTPDTGALMEEAEVGGAAETTASVSRNSNPNDEFPSPPMEISDDDDEVFIEASDELSPPSPQDSVPAEAFRRPSTGGNSSPLESSVPAEAVQTLEFLNALGLRLRSEWVTLCLKGLERSVPGFQSFGVDKKAELCFGQFLLSDINQSGAGILPNNVGGMHLVDLAGPFVLQVDEIVNISCPLRQRYHKATPGNKRSLKLSMTDGIQRVFGMEYRPIKNLDVSAPSGLKVVIRNVPVRHGLLMLVPEVIDILGGMVEELEAAHQRLLTEIDKPPRGRRPRMGDMPPISIRATRAAWPSTAVNGHMHVRSSSSRPQNTESVETPGCVSAQVRDYNTTTAGGSTPIQIVHVDVHATPSEHHHHHPRVPVPLSPVRETPFRGRSVGFNDSALDPNLHSRPQDSRSLRTSSGGGCGFNIAHHPGTQSSDGEMIDAGISSHGRGSGYYSYDGNSETTGTGLPLNTLIDVEDIHMTDDVVETTVNSVTTAETYQSFNRYGNVDEMNAEDDVEYTSMHSSNQEMPFTYLASLSAKLSASEDCIVSVQGKIKCFMTGVKGFQYKERSTYELRAYIDDGSLISEILIDHSVIQNKIGYSPIEVSAAISSSDASVVNHMKEILKNFQNFLLNFEGTMILQLKRSSPTPVAIEMNQGCSSSDVRLLLRRITNFTNVQTVQSIEPIVLSP